MTRRIAVNIAKLLERGSPLSGRPGDISSSPILASTSECDARTPWLRVQLGHPVAACGRTSAYLELPVGERLPISSPHPGKNRLSYRQQRNPLVRRIAAAFSIEFRHARF
jgi:hypothetical protein